MIGGREICGYPKKSAKSISVTRKGNEVHGVYVQRGIPIIEIRTKLTDVIEENL